MKIDISILIVEDCARTSVIVKKKIDDSVKGESGEFLPWIHQWVKSHTVRPVNISIGYNVHSLQFSQLNELLDPCCEDGVILGNVATDIHNKHSRPLVVVQDLALTQHETAMIDDAGGRDQSKPLEDIKSALSKLTGFRLIKIFSELRCVVIATSFANNPHIRQLCLEQGATCFVIKPYTSDEMAEAKEFLGESSISEPLENHITEIEGLVTMDKRRYTDAKNKVPGIDGYTAEIANEALKQVLLLQAYSPRIARS